MEGKISVSRRASIRFKKMCRRKFRKDELGYQIVTGTVLFILLVLCIYPLIYVIGASLMTEEEWIARGGLFLFPHNPTFAAYADVFREMDLYKSILVSIGRSLVGPVLSVVFCNMVFGYALSLDNLWGKRVLSVFVFVTMVFGGGTIPQYLIRDYTGLLNSFWVFVIPILLGGWSSLLFKQTFLSTPSSILESARMDGASELQILVRIMLPMHMGTVVIMIFMGAVGQWNSWFDAMLYIDSNNADLIPLQLYLKNYLAQSTESGTAIVQNAEAKKMAVAVVGILPIVLAYPFFLKYFTKGVYMGAVKE